MGEVVPASKVSPGAYRSVLFMGAPGTGKTTAALKLYPKGRKLVVDVDDKAIMALRAIPEPSRSQIQSTTHIWTPTNKRLSGSEAIGIVRQERFDAQKKVVPGTKGYIPPDPRGYQEIVDFFNELARVTPFPYELLIVDTYTVIGEHLAAMILNHHQLSAFTLPLFGIYKQNMLELTKGILALPCHRVICVHETTRESDDAEITVRPSIMGSYRDEIAKEFSEVYRFNGRSAAGKYTLRTVPNAKYIARTALPLEAECNVEDMVRLYV